MDAMTSCQMSVTEFGDALIRTQDLDPVYVAIHGAALPRDQLCRLLLAYWCFYHLGVAARLSEWRGDHYWDWMTQAARNTEPPPVGVGTATRWPRAAERRHFRGEKCVKAMGWLRWNFTSPEEPVDQLRLCDDSRQVMNQVQTWPMFGPWIAFKAADMLERCAEVPLEFNRDIGLVYEEPKKGLEMLVDREGGPSLTTRYEALICHFSKFLAPPALDRPCGPQEVETVLCKWKSHIGGHYWVGKDTHEVRHALIGWGETADKLLVACPQEVSCP